MKRILILFGVIIFGCRSSPEVSFDSLNQAFINWYFKYHPVESTRYNIKIKNGKYIKGQINKGVLGSSSKGLIQSINNDYSHMDASNFIDNIQFYNIF